MSSGQQENAGGVEPWQGLEDDEVADCHIFTVRKVKRRSPASGKESAFFYIDSNDWVNVVALTESQEIVLIRQYRHGADEITLEIPGGILDKGESAVDAARRELREETGYEPAECIEIGRVRPNPAIMNNWAYTVLATGMPAPGQASFDEHEEIDVELWPVDRIDELLRSGAITHALVIDALMWYKLYRQGSIEESQGL